MTSNRCANANRPPRKTEPLSRSELMARVKSTGNKSTEIRLSKLFRASGVRGWKRRSTIYGKPDFVFPRERVAVFVDGCFWHGCPKHCRMPKANRDYWRGKIARNKKRGTSINRELRRAGWRVLRIWEHELAKIKMTATPHPGRGGEGAEARLLNRIRRALTKR
jgi:DNA mismatch endonuclease (patch repair protein)